MATVTVSKQFKENFDLWAKDVVRGADNKTAIGSRFINARKIKSDGALKSVRIFEFDPDMRMLALITADEGRFLSDGKWELRQVEEIRFDEIYKQNPELVSRPKVVNRKMATSILSSEITPAIMAVLVTNPDKMSALDLASFSRYLAENKQRSERYEIAFWSKVLYPFAVFVMMALALPFAYLHVRSGGLSLKIFAGIMIGVSFQLINSLFTHLGLLNAWPPFATAMMPSTLFLIAAIWALRWVERH